MQLGSLAAGSTPVTLSAAAAATMLEEVQRSGNSEACGLLFGSEGRIIRVTIARNVAENPASRFEIDPAHLFDAHRQGRAGPDRLIGCWHSHPNGDGRPSSHDREGVADEGWLWLIVAAGRIHAWAPTPGGFDEVALIEAHL